MTWIGFVVISIDELYHKLIFLFNVSNSNNPNFRFRLVPDTVSDVATLSKEINQHCELSIVNKLLFGFEATRSTIQLKDLRCVCRSVFLSSEMVRVL